MKFMERSCLFSIFACNAMGISTRCIQLSSLTTHMKTQVLNTKIYLIIKLGYMHVVGLKTAEETMEARATYMM